MTPNRLPPGPHSAWNSGAQLRGLIERLASQANRAVKGFDSEAVHDLRVAVRRLNQGFLMFRDDLPRKPLKKIRKQLKAVLSAAGTVRDCDIAAKLLSRSRQSGAAPFLRHVRTARKEAERGLLGILKRLSLRTRAARWRRDLNLNDIPTRRGAGGLRTLAAERLPENARRFFELGEAARSHASGEELHQFRIVAKKFRYTLELFLPVYGSGGEEWIREVKGIQTILGDMNDYRTVFRMAADAGYGQQLGEALKRSERRQAARFREQWAERFSPSAAAEWMRVLRAPPAPARRKPAASATRDRTVAARA